MNFSDVRVGEKRKEAWERRGKDAGKTRDDKFGQVFVGS